MYINHKTTTTRGTILSLELSLTILTDWTVDNPFIPVTVFTLFTFQIPNSYWSAALHHPASPAKLPAF